MVQTLLPVTFGYSLSLEAVVMRQLWRWKRLWWRSLTHSHKKTSMGPSSSCWNSTTSALQLEEITWRGQEFHVCTINKSAHTKKSLETYLMIFVQIQLIQKTSKFWYLIFLFVSLLLISILLIFCSNFANLNLYEYVHNNFINLLFA